MGYITVEEIIKVARIKTDTVYSTHTTDEECIILLNDIYRELYMFLLGCDANLFIEEAVLTIENGVATLPADLLKINSVFYKSGSIDNVLEQRSLQDRINNVVARAPYTYYLKGDKICFDSQNVVQPIRIYYTPQPKKLTQLSDQIFLFGNEDMFLKAKLQKELLAREESDTRKADEDIAIAINSIRNMLFPRDAGTNPTVRDVYQANTNLRFKGTYRTGVSR